jgi:hypothetical protein
MAKYWVCGSLKEAMEGQIFRDGYEFCYYSSEKMAKSKDNGCAHHPFEIDEDLLLLLKATGYNIVPRGGRFF